MKKQFNRIFAVVLGIAILASSLIIGGATDTPVTAAETASGTAAPDNTKTGFMLGETYTFDFNDEGDVKSYTANTDSSVDEDGTVFYPLHSVNDTTKVEQETFINAAGEEVTAAAVTGQRTTHYIPTDSNGLPFEIEPNASYKVDVVMYVRAAYKSGQAFFGGGMFQSNKAEFDPDTSLTFDSSIAYNNADLNLDSADPVYRTSSLGHQSESVYYETPQKYESTLYFSTGDFDLQNGVFYLMGSDGSYHSFGNYFGIYLSISKNDIVIDDVNYGPACFLFDSISITKTAGMDIGDSFTFNFDSQKETGAYIRNIEGKTYDASKAVDGEGNTFYPFHIGHSSSTSTSYADAAYSPLTVKTEDGTETLGTLKLLNRYTNDGNYIPTKNGIPFVIEPNTKYEVKFEAYTQYGSTSVGVRFGGGMLNADQPYYDFENFYPASASDGTQRFYTKGTSGGESVDKVVSIYPMYTTSHAFKSSSGNYYTSAGKQTVRMYADDDFDNTGKNAGQYHNDTLTFTTGNFTNVNNTYTTELSPSETETVGDTTVNKAYTVGAYFGIYFDGATLHAYDSAGTQVTSEKLTVTHYIDYITITKVAQTATVTYDANGGAFAGGEATQTVTETVGESITAETPVNADETLAFAGWSLTKDGLPGTSVDGSLNGKTLYALWKTPVTVTFDANGGTFSDGTESQTLTKYVGLPMSCPTPSSAEGSFLGWAKSADAVEAEAITEFVTADMADTTYYAVWSRSPHPADGVYDDFTRTVEFLNGTYEIDSSNSYNNDNAAFNGYYFEVIDNPDEEGDGLLHYCSDKETSVTYNANWCITPTYNGDSTAEVTADNNILSANSTYKITARVYIKSTDGYTADFTAFLGSKNGSSSNSGRYYGRTNMVEDITETDGFVDVVGYYTTPAQYQPDTKDGSVCNRLYVGFRSPDSGYHLEYYLDSLTIEKVTNTNLYVMEDGGYVLKETLKGVPGTELTIPEYYSVENYSASDATGSETRFNYNGDWYADEACTEAPVMKYGNYDVDLYCDTPVTEVGPVRLDNQEMFVGFDTYTQRTNGFSVPALKLGCASDKLSLSDKEANSGSVSLKADISAGDTLAFELKNDYTLDVMAGKTYRVDFVYKASADAGLSLGLSQGSVANGVTPLGDVSLERAEDWTNASVIITADGATESSVLAAQLTADAESVVYIDTMIVSSATESVGVEGTTTDNGEALRFMLSYSGDTVKMAGVDYTVTERGVIVKGQDVDTALTVENADKAGIFRFAQTDLTKNWSVNPITGTTVYSAYLEGFETDDDYKVSVRGYVTLNDGTVYYTDTLTASVTDIPEAGDIIPETADLTDYYVYLPEGTTLPADVASTATTYNEVFVESTALSNNTLTEGAYVKFSTRPDFDAVSVPDELKYLVHAGTKAQLYFGVDAQLVTEQLSSVGQDKVNYIFITDTHFSESTTSDLGKSIINQMNLITKMANENDNIDFVVVGGDITTGTYTSKEDHIKYTQTALDPLLNCTKPVFVLMGNHDDNSYHLEKDSTTLYSDRVVTDLDWQTNIINRYTNINGITVNQDTERDNSKYFYYDLDENTRVVALDALDYQAKYDANGNVITTDANDDGFIDGMPIRNTAGTTDKGKYWSGCTYWGYSADQLRWLAEDALNTNKEVIFVSHMGIDITTNSYMNTVQFGNELRDIITAYQSKTEYSATLTGVWGDTVDVTADFSDSTGKIVSYQFGHQHTELTIYDYDVDLWQISTPSARGVDNSKQTVEEFQTSSINVKSLPWRVYTRQWNSETEASFNVMSVSSDAVYRMTVGQGRNEKLIYPN